MIEEEDRARSMCFVKEWRDRARICGPAWVRDGREGAERQGFRPDT